YLFVILPIRPDGTIDFAHAAVSDLFDDLISADVASDAAWSGNCRRNSTSQINRRVLQENTARVFMGSQQRFNFLMKCGIAVAGFIQISGALVGGQSNGLIENLPDLLPKFSFHVAALRSSSR